MCARIYAAKPVPSIFTLDNPTDEWKTRGGDISRSRAVSPQRRLFKYPEDDEFPLFNAAKLLPRGWKMRSAVWSRAAGVARGGVL